MFKIEGNNLQSKTCNKRERNNFNDQAITQTRSLQNAYFF